MSDRDMTDSEPPYCAPKPKIVSQWADELLYGEKSYEDRKRPEDPRAINPAPLKHSQSQAFCPNKASRVTTTAPPENGQASLIYLPDQPGITVTPLAQRGAAISPKLAEVERGWKVLAVLVLAGAAVLLLLAKHTQPWASSLLVGLPTLNNHAQTRGQTGEQEGLREKGGHEVAMWQEEPLEAPEHLQPLQHGADPTRGSGAAASRRLLYNIHGDIRAGSRADLTKQQHGPYAGPFPLGRIVDLKHSWGPDSYPPFLCPPQGSPLPPSSPGACSELLRGQEMPFCEELFQCTGTNEPLAAVPCVLKSFGTPNGEVRMRMKFNTNKAPAAGWNDFQVFSKEYFFGDKGYDKYHATFTAVKVGSGLLGDKHIKKWGKGKAAHEHIQCEEGKQCDQKTTARAVQEVRDRVLNYFGKMYGKAALVDSAPMENRGGIGAKLALNQHFHFDTYPEPCGKKSRTLRAFVNIDNDYRVWGISYNISEVAKMNLKSLDPNYELAFANMQKKLKGGKTTNDLDLSLRALKHIIDNKREKLKGEPMYSYICDLTPVTYMLLPPGAVWITDANIQSHMVQYGSSSMTMLVDVPAATEMKCPGTRAGDFREVTF